MKQYKIRYTPPERPYTPLTETVEAKNEKLAVNKFYRNHSKLCLIKEIVEV